MKDEVWKRDEIQSPCVKLCVVHPEERICVGCLRSMEEIATWSRLSHEARAAVMADLPDLSAHQVYACGAPIVVDSARQDFVAQCTLPEEEFYADSFTTEADLAKAG